VREHPASCEKRLFWVASSRNDLLRFPDRVIDEIGTALSVAQFGGKHRAAKAWKGAGSGVFEIVEDYDRATYRAVYTVRYERAIYVLHCFQKKSPSGIRTPRHDVELITRRLRQAETHYEENYPSRED
jgi:phage-related protein